MCVCVAHGIIMVKNRVLICCDTNVRILVLGTPHNGPIVPVPISQSIFRSVSDGILMLYYNSGFP